VIIPYSDFPLLIPGQDRLLPVAAILKVACPVDTRAFVVTNQAEFNQLH